MTEFDAFLLLKNLIADNGNGGQRAGAVRKTKESVLSGDGADDVSRACGGLKILTTDIL